MTLAQPPGGGEEQRPSDTTSPEELVLNRVLDAPRELVYPAFTGSAQLARWFGPVSLSVPRVSVDIDARVGGHQRFTMVNDDDPNVTSGNAPSPRSSRSRCSWATRRSRASRNGGNRRDVPAGRVHDENGKTRPGIRQGPYSGEMDGMARAGRESSRTELHALDAG